MYAVCLMITATSWTCLSMRQVRTRVCLLTVPCSNYATVELCMHLLNLCLCS